MNRRWLVLAPLLCFTLVATAWVSKEDESSKTPLAEKNKRQSASTQISSSVALKSEDADVQILNLEKLQQRAVISESESTLFVQKSWFIPPPPPKPAPPPPPSAPPLPFIYMGQLLQDKHLIVYLVKGDQTYNVKEGDIIDNLYRIESTTSQQLVFVYLPLSIKQILVTGTGS